MRYVIHIFTQETAGREYVNHYGYWDGRTYRHRGYTFPHLTRDVTEATKRYKSRQCAENMVEKLPGRIDKVVRILIETIDETT